MSLISDIERLERLDQLIRLRATGNVEELAKKFHTSRSTIDRIIRTMKELGCPIVFSQRLNTYYYESEGRLILNFRSLSKKEQNTIKGGFFRKNYLTSNNGVRQIYFRPEKQTNCFSGFPTPTRVGFKNLYK